MPSLFPSNAQNSNPGQRNRTWSRSEKAIARKAFDGALQRELQEVIEETQRMAAAITQSADLWKLENHLTKRRKEIDQKYQFRESRRIEVLGRLLHQKRVGAEDLRGLAEDKLKTIRSFAEFLCQQESE